MSKVIASAIAAVAVLSSCTEFHEARVPMATPAEDSAGRQFAPPPAGHAAVYVFRAGKPQPIVLNITIGQKLMANIGTNSWARMDLPAGRTDLRCSGPMADTTALLLDLSPGDIRFVEITEEHFRIVCKLAEVPASIGRAGVLSGQRVREL